MSPSLPRDVPQSINGSSESPSAISDPFAQLESSPSSQPSSEQDGTTAVEAQAPAGRRNNLPVSPPTRSHLPSSTVLQDGYDSDVGINHNEAIAMEGPLEVEEAEIGEVSEVGDALAVANNPTDNAANDAEQPTVVLIPEDEMKKMKVSELKLELSKRGLSNKGLKQALLDRLKQAMTDRVPVLSEQQRREQEEEHVSGFSATARWKPHVPLEEVVEEPTNVTRSLRPPTVPEEDNDFVAQKHNFQEMFDRAPFLGKKKVPKCHRNGHQMKDFSTNQPLWNDEVDVKGGPRAEWILEQGLSSASHPADWFDAFLPVYNGTTRTPSHSNTPFWTHRWANYLNMKASQMGAGVMGGIYPDFRPFTFEDIERQNSWRYLGNSSHSTERKPPAKCISGDDVAAKEQITWFADVRDTNCRSYKCQVFWQLFACTPLTFPRKTTPLLVQMLIRR